MKKNIVIGGFSKEQREENLVNIKDNVKPINQLWHGLKPKNSVPIHKLTFYF